MKRLFKDVQLVLTSAITLAIGLAFGAVIGSALVDKPNENETRAAQNELCLKANMKPILEKGEIVCSPSEGIQLIRDFFDTKMASIVIAEKLRQEGFRPKGDVNWPSDKKEDFRKLNPIDPNSFETKSKVTE